MTSALLAAGLSGCTHSSAQASLPTSITVRPQSALIDVPVTVSIKGLPPGKQVSVTASAVDGDRVPWKGTERFAIGTSGTVTLNQPSLGGSYTGKNPMGFLEFMAPPADEDASAYVASGLGYSVTLTASVDGRTVATTNLRRDYPTAAPIRIRDLSVAHDGVWGELDMPATHMRARPAVLLFGGSDGGLDTFSTLTARLLAAHGYPALALAYFDGPGLPAFLEDIPLEYFVKALKILEAQPGVDPKHVLVYGDSRGSEAALLLGADFPSLVHGVIAGVPSAVVLGSYPTHAGHYVGGMTAYIPVTAEYYKNTGGTLAANQQAAAQAHAQLLHFLAKQ